MNCERAKSELSLFLYGELSFEEEERLQAHLDGCEGCRGALEAEKRLFSMLDSAEAELPEQLLSGCRNDLRSRLAAEPARSTHSVWRSRIEGWLDVIRGGSPAGWLRPAGVLALVVAGFFAGRSVGPASGVASVERIAPMLSMDPLSAQPVTARVRQVESSEGGRLRIVVDETRQRVISGNAEDDAIRRLLLAATTDPNDPGLRGETVEILRNSTPSDEVRQALLFALQHDSNDGVRLRALEGLKPYVKIPDVRRAFVRVLLEDLNSGVRTQAVDILTKTRTEPGAEMPIVGACQQLMARESNSYIRMQCQKRLREVRASEEMY